MDLSPHIKPNKQAPAWQHILLALGLCGTGLVIFLLSGGFPATTWRVLYQVLSHTATLQNTMGPGLIGLILLLAVQSLLIAAAWAALLWIAIREYNLVCTLYLGPLVAGSTAAPQRTSSAQSFQTGQGSQQQRTPQTGKRAKKKTATLPFAAGLANKNVAQSTSKANKVTLIPGKRAEKPEKKAAGLPFAFGGQRKNKNVVQPANDAPPAPANIYAQQFTAGTFSPPPAPALISRQAKTLEGPQPPLAAAHSVFNQPYQSAPLPDLKSSLQPSVLQTAKLNDLADNPPETPEVLDLSNPFETIEVKEVVNPFEEAEVLDLSNPFEEPEMDQKNPFAEQDPLPSIDQSPVREQKRWTPTIGSPFEEFELQAPEPDYPVAEQPWEQQTPFPSLESLEEADFEEQQPPAQVANGEQAVNSVNAANFDNPFQVIDDTPEIYRQMETSWQPYGPKPTTEPNVFARNTTLPLDSRMTPQDPLSLTQPLDQHSTLPLSGIPLDQRSTLPILNESTAQVVGMVTHPGRKRIHKPNEDTPLVILADRPLANTSLSAGLFLVADGMGGHNDGKFASDFVTGAISKDLTALLSNTQTSHEELKDRFVTAIKEANQQLTQKNRAEGVMRGTTLTGALIVELMTSSDDTTHRAYVANIGDSRTYLFSAKQGLKRVTRDHSTVENLIEQGEITPEERYTDRRRNQIDRCMGNELSIEVDIFELALKPMERLLICSDGLWEMVRDDKLATLMAVPVNDPAQITQLLLQSALEGGGEDNVTAIVVQIPA